LAAQLARADYYAKLTNWDVAGPIFADLEKQFAAAGDTRDALYAHVSGIEAGIESLNLEQSSEEMTQILARPDVRNDLSLKQRCLEVKGRVDLNRDGVSARPSFEELERVAKLRHDGDAASRASGELGILSFLEGNSSDAIKRILNALAHAVWSHDVGAEIRYLSLLAQGLVENHSPNQALLAIDHAISLAKETDGAGFPKIAVSARTAALTELGKFQEAQQVVNLGLAYGRQHHYLGYQVEMLAAGGQLARAEGNIQSAINQYLEAASLARRIHFNRGLAEVDAQLASLYQIAGNLPKADGFAHECIQVHRELGEVYELPHHLAVEADIQSALGNVEEAEQTFSTAERIVGTMLANSPTAAVKRAVVSAMSEVFVGHFELEVKRGNFREAYRVIEEARGRVTADRLWAVSDFRGFRKPPEITAAERKLALLQIKLLDSTSDQEQQTLLDAISEAENQLSIPREPQLENVAWRRPDLADLQRTLSKDEVLLEYVIGTDASYCMSITGTDVQVTTLPGRKTIDALVDRYQTAVHAELDAKPQGQALYDVILKPVLSKRNQEKVIVVADGSLYSVPFAAVTDDQNQYLLESRTISYSPSGTVFELMRARSASVPRELLAVGDVDYGNRFQAGFDELFREVKVLRSDKFENLPGTGDEVTAVQSALKDVKGVVLSKKNATEGNFKSDAVKPLAVIHLALHAVADTKYPDRSALVFAPDTKSGEDGLLQVREIRKLPIAGTSLVTLSACDTSVGRVEGQEGISNIVYAFLYAGARSAVATFWKVEDTATAQLMARFYTELGHGTQKAEALRQGQLELAHSSNRLRLPFFWAAFNLTGEGSDNIKTEEVR
jgi:CHAT domain-containing protein